QKVNLKIRVPKAYPVVENSRLLVMEKIDHVPVDDIKKNWPKVLKAAGRALERMTVEEVMLHPLKGHPLLRKTAEWAEENGLEFDMDAKTIVGTGWEDTPIDPVVLFGYDSGVTTMGEHIKLLQLAQLDHGLVHGDPHDGNLLWRKPVVNGDTIE